MLDRPASAGIDAAAAPAARRRAARAVRAWPSGPTSPCRASRPGSASGSPWPGRCCTTPRCCSSTSRRPGLDPAATRDVVELIGALAGEHGRTVVLCTHFLGEAGRLAHRMAVLHRGRLQAFGRARRRWPPSLAGPRGRRRPRRAGRRRAIARPRRRDRRRARRSTATPTGAAACAVDDRDVLPARRRRARRPRGRRSTRAVPRPPTLEDVYFAIEAPHQPTTDAR